MTDLETYYKAEGLMRAYVEQFNGDYQDINTLRSDLVDTDFIKVMETRKGKRTVISQDAGFEDPPIKWRYETYRTRTTSRKTNS